MKVLIKLELVEQIPAMLFLRVGKALFLDMRIVHAPPKVKAHHFIGVHVCSVLQ